MIYYRFPLLLAACITCLSFAPIARGYSPQLKLTMTMTTSSASSLSGDWEVAQAQPSPGSDASYDRYMNQGYQATRAKNYQAALENFNNALEERPNDPYAQRAIENVKSYQEQNSQGRWGEFALRLGVVAIAAGVVGGLFFFLGRLSQATSKAEREPLSEQEPDPDDFSPLPEGINDDVNATTTVTNTPKTKANLQTLPNQDQVSVVKQTTRLPKIDIVETLIQDLNAPDSSKRRKAIWELAQRADSRAVTPLVELLIDSDSKQRSLILEALAQIGTRTLKPLNRALTVSLQDESPEVRKNAIRDLLGVYESVLQVSNVLSHAANDSDAEVQETARWALSQLNSNNMSSGFGLLQLNQNQRNTSENSHS